MKRIKEVLWMEITMALNLYLGQALDYAENQGRQAMMPERERNGFKPES